jgi:hypothetical protein
MAFTPYAPPAAPQNATGATPSFTPYVPPTATPQTSALDNVKNFAVGALKGVGSDVTGLAKLAVEQGPGMAASAIGLPAAGLQLPGQSKLTGVVDKANTAMMPSGAQQTGYNTEQIGELLIPFLGAGAKTITKAPEIANALERASLRLTPAVKRDLGEKLNGVTQWLLNNKVIGNPSQRLDQVTDIYNSMEDKLHNFLKTNNTATGISASRSAIVDDLEGLKTTFKNSRDYQAVVKQVDDAKQLFTKAGTFVREKIPILRLNELKRSTFDGAYNKAGAKVLDDVEHAIGNVFKNHVETATDGLSIEGKSTADFNKEYGTVINARSLLKAAESRDEVGMLGKIISTIVGGGVGNVLGGPVGAGVGVLTGNQIAPLVAGTRARSAAAALANVASKAAPAAQKALLPLGVGAAGLIKKGYDKLFPSQQ